MNMKNVHKITVSALFSGRTWNVSQLIHSLKDSTRNYYFVQHSLFSFLLSIFFFSFFIFQSLAFN